MGHGSILRQYAGAITRPDARYTEITRRYAAGQEPSQIAAWLNTLGFTDSGVTPNGYIKLRNHHDLGFRIQELNLFFFHLITHLKRRAILRPGLAVIVYSSRGDIRMPQPFLHLGNVCLMIERIGCGGCA